MVSMIVWCFTGQLKEKFCICVVQRNVDLKKKYEKILKGKLLPEPVTCNTQVYQCLCKYGLFFMMYGYLKY